MKSRRINKLVLFAILGIAVTAGVMVTSCGKGDYTHEGPVDKAALSQIGFYETYNVGEIADVLRALDKEAAERGGMVDSMSFANLTGYETSVASMSSTPIIGYVSVNDTASVNRIITQYGDRCLPADLKLTWTRFPEKSQFGPDLYLLIALKLTGGGPAMKGESIIEAMSSSDEIEGNTIDLMFNVEGASVFSRITAQNVNRAIAVVIDGKVYSFPTVNQQIDGGRVQISGLFTKEETQNVVDFIYGKDELKK